MTYRSVQLRLARSLAHDGLILYTNRPDSRLITELGRHYAIDVQTNMICVKDIDIERMARDRKLIGPEVVVAEPVVRGLNKLIVQYPQRYFPALDTALGKLSLGEAKVPPTRIDGFVGRLFELKSNADAKLARGRVQAVLQKHDAIGARLWLAN